jgi:hypothetical protein
MIHDAPGLIQNTYQQQLSFHARVLLPFQYTTKRNIFHLIMRLYQPILQTPLLAILSAYRRVLPTIWLLAGVLRDRLLVFRKVPLTLIFSHCVWPDTLWPNCLSILEPTGTRQQLRPAVHGIFLRYLRSIISIAISLRIVNFPALSYLIFLSFRQVTKSWAVIPNMSLQIAEETRQVCRITGEKTSTIHIQLVRDVRHINSQCGCRVLCRRVIGGGYIACVPVSSCTASCKRTENGTESSSSFGNGLARKRERTGSFKPAADKAFNSVTPNKDPSCPTAICSHNPN